MRISIAELKRRLPPGTEFTAEYVMGDFIVHSNVGKVVLPAAIENKTRRQVVSITPRLASRVLEGVKKDHVIYLDWTGIWADQHEDGSIVLFDTDVEPAKAMLRITFDKGASDAEETRACDATGE